MQTILGASGTIGKLLARELLSYTDRVRLVCRNPVKINDNGMITWIVSKVKAGPKITLVPKWMLYPLSVFIPVMREMPEMMYQYDRTLAYVYLEDGTFVIDSMVKNGYATVMTTPPNVRYADIFVELARKARNRNRGLWMTSSE